MSQLVIESHKIRLASGFHPSFLKIKDQKIQSPSAIVDVVSGRHGVNGFALEAGTFFRK
jgi:hypothetical protein